ncbi:MAG: hypothetical protein HKN40_12520 [Winogradskyella sp.]|uniref:hypothetical protein n=1 Tax=Winogradskyella sp. TaxID=1883156 RepID=UPI0017E54BA0|nr:hypothetical protein [Winogradskyella sp.]
MKNLIRSSIALAISSLLLLISCVPEENDPTCNCEEVFYAESKYQEGTSDVWLLDRTETSREPVACQDETDYTRTGNGTEVSRIECL